MGLDWLAGNKAKPGHEAEFAELLEKGREGGISDEMRERFSEISIAAYTQVGAPVVGTDRIADAWVLVNIRMRDQDDDEIGDDEIDDDEDDEPIDLEDPASYSPQTDDEREALEQMKGYYVLELAPECDGLPIYTHGSMSDQLDLTSFRGKFLHDCEDILGEELMETIYTDLMPEELVALGNTLLEHARRVASDNKCPEIETEAEPPDDFETPAGQAHILFAAGRWCVYWGSRGHYLDTWF